MSQLTLADPEVKDTLDLYLRQARICAETSHTGCDSILGVAAMCTAFPCLLSVGEALASHREPYGSGKPVPTKVAIESFYRRMRDKSWLIPPANKTCDDTEACRKLTEIRHGLAHAVSMPPSTSLIRRKETARKRPPCDWKIVVPVFVKAIEQTIADIRQGQPDLDLSDVVKENRTLVHWVQGSELLCPGYPDSATASDSKLSSSAQEWGHKQEDKP